jgi:hypothetical protein
MTEAATLEIVLGTSVLEIVTVWAATEVMNEFAVLYEPVRQLLLALTRHQCCVDDARLPVFVYDALVKPV